MESSRSLAKAKDVPGHRWAMYVGTAIALLTLVLPTLTIAYYSTAAARQSPLSPGQSVR
ncbi:MAG: hypothetical protein AAGG51_06265 [Cyanobacteria bacterium P01_G01_bin.54]